MAIPFLIGDEQRRRISELIEYAMEHRIGMDDLKKMSEGKGLSPGDDPNRVILIPFAYRAVFTIEQQPFGWCRHLSLSCTAKGRHPNEWSLGMLAEEFGMPPLKKCICYPEKWDGGTAINCIGQMKDDPSEDWIKSVQELLASRK